MTPWHNQEAAQPAEAAARAQKAQERRSELFRNAAYVLAVLVVLALVEWIALTIPV